MRFSNLFRSLAAGLALFAVSVSAQTVAKAHVIYDGSGLFYADNEANFKFKALDQKRDGTYIVEFSEERLKPDAIEARRLRFGLQCTEGKNDCGTKLYSDESSLPTLKELFPDYVYQEKDQPVYEVWVKVTKDGVEILPGIPEEYVVPDPVEKTFMLLPPWSNTTAIMSVDGKDHRMIPAMSNYCGWFETTLNIVPKDAYASFKQTIGDMYIGNDGISRNPIDVMDEIPLDSILNVGTDTVWIMAKLGFPELYSEFPGDTSDCPVKKLPVMMFDWLHGTEGDGVEGNGNPKYGVSADFGSGGCKNSDTNTPIKGMVENELGPNGVPVRAQDFPSNCKITEHLDYWFTPEVVAKDAAGKQYTNVTCRDLTLELDNDGFWLGQRDKDSPERGLFLLDDFIWLDSAHTIKNPYHDEVLGVINKDDTIGVHNYGYTMKIQAQFEYVPGQYFEFFGDDDVWVFINNKLVVDIGGQHHQVSGKVNLDDIGKKIGKKGDTLVPGQTYPFHIFYAERHSSESNFKMRTSIDLRSDASMFLSDLGSTDELIKKEVWQKVRERKLACDFSSNSGIEKTERGPSDFVLYGKSLPKGGVPLKTLDSLYYKGIKVQNNFTMVTIDLKAIEHAQSLPPGTYYVRITLKENPDEYKDVYFTIPPYALPNLAFASVKDSIYKVIDFETKDTINYTKFWQPLGEDPTYHVNSDTLPINFDKSEKLWAGRSYLVSIMYAEEWATIYSDIAVKISASTPALIACDSMGNVITEVVLMEGRAHFFVKATDEVVNGTLTVSTDGSTNKSVNWTNINIAVPPVPQVEVAYIFDRTGDGRADSIWISFDKPLGGHTPEKEESVLDSLNFIFGSEFDIVRDNESSSAPYAKLSYNKGDTFATIVATSDRFGSPIYTGGATSIYSGKLNIWYTYTDSTGKETVFPIEGVLTDKVGPVIVAAEVSYMTDGNTMLKLSFSEGISEENANTELFRFHCWNADILDSAILQATDIGTTPANQWKLIFPRGTDTDIIPSVGDSVRFTPPSELGEALDLLGVGPHEDNPFVRITGEQKITVSSPTIVELDPSSPAFEEAREIMRSDSATVPKFIDSDKPLTVNQVAEKYGTQGHYLSDLDMGTLVENEIAEIVKSVQSVPSYIDKNDKTSGIAQTYTIEQIIEMVGKGELSIDKAQKRFDLDATIVNAYKNGLLTEKNIHAYASGSEAQIQTIIDSVASHTELYYRTIYYTSLGQFVNEDHGVIRCSDKVFSDTDTKTCRGSKGRFYLAWNMRAANRRLVSTGVYIARLELRVKVNSKILTNRTRDFLWGVRHGKFNVMDIDY